MSFLDFPKDGDTHTGGLAFMLDGRIESPPGIVDLFNNVDYGLLNGRDFTFGMEKAKRSDPPTRVCK